MMNTEQQRLGRPVGAQSLWLKTKLPCAPSDFLVLVSDVLLACQTENIIFDLDFSANLRSQWVLLTFLWPHSFISLGLPPQRHCHQPRPWPLSSRWAEQDFMGFPGPRLYLLPQRSIWSFFLKQPTSLFPVPKPQLSGFVLGQNL